MRGGKSEKGKEKRGDVDEKTAEDQETAKWMRRLLWAAF